MLACLGLITLAVLLALRSEVSGRRSEPGAPRAALELTGVVRSHLGAVVAGAVVRATPSDPDATPGHGSSIRAVTDANGTYRLRVAANDLVLEASHGDYTPQSVRIRSGPGGGQRADFVMLPLGSIGGRVRNVSDGRGVGAVTVRARRAPMLEPTAYPPERVATTDPEGNFSIAGLAPGVVEVSASAATQTTSVPSLVTLESGQRFEGVEVWVDSAHALSGTVVTASADRRAVAGVWVEARGARDGELATADGPTDAQGRFRVAGLRPGRYDLFVQRHRSSVPVAAAAVDIVDRDIEGYPVSIAPGVTIAGRLSDAVDATVRLQRLVDSGAGPSGGLHNAAEAHVTPARPTFYFHAVPPGDFLIVATATDGRAGQRTVHAGPHPLRELVIELQKRASISGRVLDDSGVPARQAWVMLTSGMPQGNWRTKPADQLLRYELTDENGSFRATGLAGGAYDLSVYRGRRPQTWSSPKDPQAPSEPVEVQLEAGEPRVGVVLTVAACNDSVRGVILDPGGAPLGNVRVGAVKEERKAVRFEPFGSRAEHWTTTDASGRFVLDGLCGGTYEVRARAMSEACCAAQRFVPAGANVTLRLGRSATVVGAVHQGGTPITDYVLDITGPVRWRGRIRDENGKYRVSALPPGEYEASVQSREGLAFRSVVVTAGELLGLDLEVESFSSVRGRAVGLDGKPIVGIEVAASYESTPGVVESSVRARLQDRRTVTDDGGAFELGALISGKSRLLFTLGGRAALVLNGSKIDAAEGDLFGPLPWLDVETEAGESAELGAVKILSRE